MPYQQPKSPYWWISYTDPSGRRIRRSTGETDYQAAKALEHKLRAEGIEQRNQHAAPATSFEDIMVTYLRHRNTDRERYAVMALRQHMAGVDMLQLKPSDITDYIGKRKEASVTDGTIRRELTVLSAAINHYADEHQIAMPNPVKKRKPPKTEGRVRWINYQEARRLLDCAAQGPSYLTDFIVTGLHTGMRKQEMLGLDWNRVNLGHRLIMLEAPHTKSKRRRSIPINEEVRKALLNRWNWTRQHCPETPWVFCEESGQRLGDVKRSFKTACRRSNIVDFHIHDLRHTCAAWLVTAGASLSAVRDLLGHTTVETTEIYAHLSPEAVREAVGKLNGCHTERHTDHTETYLEMVR